MPVIAFASLVVEAKHTTLICDVGQSVLEGVAATRKWLWKLPERMQEYCADRMEIADIRDIGIATQR